MKRRDKPKTGERGAFTALLRRSAIWLVGLLAFMLGAQILSWRLGEDSQAARRAALDMSQRQESVANIVTMAQSFAQPMSLDKRVDRVAEIDNHIISVRTNSKSNVANGALRNLQDALRGLAKDPNWKTGRSLKENSIEAVNEAASKASFQFSVLRRRADEDLRRTSERTNQMRLMILLVSIGACATGYVLFLHPTAVKLLKFYFQFEEALARIETQRAELQTQNIKLRDQTALAEEQRRDLEELTHLYKSNANQFQALFAGLPVACYVMRKTGEIYEWNSACERLFGVSEAEALRQAPWEAIFGGPDAEFIRAQFNKALSGRMAGEAETQITRPDGEKRWILSQSIPITDISGNVTGVLTAAVDLTERKLAELQLNESRTLVSRMMESSPQIAYVLELSQFHIEYANSQISRVIGISAQELSWRSTSLRELVHPDDEETIARHYEQIRISEEERIFEVEFRVLHVSGTYRWVRTREVIFQRDERGRVSHVVGSAEDITQRRADEERLRLLSVVAEKSNSGIVIADPRRRIVYANPAYSEITGFDASEVVGPDGMLLESIVVPSQDGWAAFDHALQKGAPVRSELLAEKANGQSFWLSISVTPVNDAHNQLSHFVAILEDVTLSRKAHIEIAASRERLDFALRNSRSAAFDWDLAENAMHLSADMETLFGLTTDSPAENCEHWIHRVHEADRAELRATLEAVTSGQEKNIRNEHRLVREDGTFVWTQVIGQVVSWNSEGKPLRCVGTFADITDRKDADQKLTESEQRWNFALEGSGAGVWDWDFQRKTVFLSRQWKQLLGFGDKELGNTFAEWESCIHPEDKEAWLRDIESHLRGQSDMLSTVVRMRHKDGEWRWFHDRGKIVSHSAEGRPLRMIGMVTDITDQKLAALQLAESEARFRAAIDALREGFILQEVDGRIQMANPQASIFTGVPLPLLISGKESCFLDNAVTEDQQPFDVEDFPTRVALRTGEPTPEVTIGLRNQGPEIKWIEMSAAPLRRPGETEPYAAVTIFSDITERRRMEEQMFEHLLRLQDTQNKLETQQEELLLANERLNKLATTDGLTGLMNHRHFQETLEKALGECREADAPISIALIDVDFFKKFNDTFGHLEGDEVLRSVARILAEAIGEQGVVARYGGEEFIVMLPRLDAATAMEVLEKTRAAVAGNAWTKREITVSVGVATMTDEAWTRTEFANLADMALYRSKENGRNQVTHAQTLDNAEAA